ncbi:hypothetical protein DFH94DRAFT_768601 [Russula ochroleuca]|uniref:Uncharacterized protein n=1 Tax=Russula ochroleuca TaxID=152965 RepID=A0A9P5MQ55_9AGAM|nr:hypothetical protein DFH94DRAFT_768601 [Russula ochroleuca]
MPQPDDKKDADIGYEIFDRKVDLSTGTIVPQPTWIGVTEKTGVLCPMFFVRRDGTLGVPYEYPAPAQSPLHNATAPAPALLRRRNQNMRIRIQWPGYEEFHYEFRILDRKLGQHVPITMSRLVERVMRGIHRLFLEGERDPNTFSEGWKLGEGGIQPQEIHIIGMLHISKGTWMPILQLDRHIIPRCEWGHEIQKKQSEEED